MVLGYIPPVLQPDDSSNSDYDRPLSNFASTSSGHVPIMSVLGSSTESEAAVLKPKRKKNFRMKEPSEYTGGGGIAQEIIELENVTPTQLFRLFWSEELIEIISCQTNLYATQKGTPYTPTTPEEIEVFFALNLIMGIKKLPSYKDY